MTMRPFSIAGLRPGLVYGTALCATYMATGLTRALWLNEAARPVLAALWEGAVYLAAGVLFLALLPKTGPLAAQAEQHPVVTGLTALFLYAVADALIAAGLCGVPLIRHFSRFIAPDGRIQLLALLLYALLPLFWFHEAAQQPGAMPRK